MTTFDPYQLKLDVANLEKILGRLKPAPAMETRKKYGARKVARKVARKDPPVPEEEPPKPTHYVPAEPILDLTKTKPSGINPNQPISWRDQLRLSSLYGLNWQDVLGKLARNIKAATAPKTEDELLERAIQVLLNNTGGGYPGYVGARYATVIPFLHFMPIVDDVRVFATLHADDGSHAIVIVGARYVEDNTLKAIRRFAELLFGNTKVQREDAFLIGHMIGQLAGACGGNQDGYPSIGFSAINSYRIYGAHRHTIHPIILSPSDAKGRANTHLDYKVFLAYTGTYTLQNP